MRNLYVLLVGINDYVAPLSALRGCIKDIDRIESFIQAHYQDQFKIHMMRLENDEATYQNIVDRFRSHLYQASKDDVAWFHFSGHGSEEAAAPEFKTLDPTGKDQTLICFDSRNGSDHLADKELAVLVHELNTIDPSGQPKESPHVVISLDCCHSGSGTRDAMSEVIGVRNAESSGQSRTLESYANGYYSRQGKPLQIPVSRHVLLAGCKSIQTAGDMARGGCFTQCLIDELEDTGGAINYSDLHLRSKRGVIRLRKNKQTPQFETLNNFNPYSKFLDGSPLGSPELYSVEHTSGQWFLKAGAIHGIPTQTKQPIEVMLILGEKEVGLAEITSVGAQKSQLKTTATLDQEEQDYKAYVLHLHEHRSSVTLTGDAALCEQLTSIVTAGNHLFNFVPETASEEASIRLTVQPNALMIEDLEQQKTVWETDGSEEQQLGIALETLEMMVKWKRMIGLSNQDRSSQLVGKAKLVLQVQGADRSSNEYDNDVELIATTANTRNGLMGFQPKVKFQALDQELYFYLFHLRSNYSVLCHDGEMVYRPDEHDSQGEITLPLWSQVKGWGLSPEDNAAVSYFKLLVTSEPLQYQELEQIGLVRTRDAAVQGWDLAPLIANDWQCKTIAVRMVRESDAINSERGVSLVGGNIRIRPHKGIRAGVSVRNAFEVDRSTASGGAPFADLHSPEFSITSFASTRNQADVNVLELNNIELGNTDLSQEPLEVELNDQLAEGELMLPIAFDGEHYQIIGEAQAEADHVVIKINDLPATTGERSLAQTVKFAFMKLVLKKKKHLHQLHWVFLHPDKSFEKSNEGLARKIREANNILLLTHGILGNTASMLKEHLESDDPIFSDYDLLLTFDYESLNTPLEESARILHNQLMEVGVSSEKKITFFGHSTGALMLRWLVEKEGGNHFAEKVYLLGAPNNGSAFGHIEHGRKFASTALELAINFIPNLVPMSGIVLKTLKNIGEVTTTLGQTKPGSEFLKSLNNSADPGVPYYIVGGDVAAYQTNGGAVGSFLQKTQLKLSNIFNKNEKHDLFTTIKSMENAIHWDDWNPKPQMLPTLDCHHYNYLSARLNREKSMDKKE
ncbi:MAG: caspase family protein [Saprospiraceae bacterium]|nr:caspase family protein [Saprospiraceae bacterium]